MNALLNINSQNGIRVQIRFVDTPNGCANVCSVLAAYEKF